ncbi:MAG: hypothetical protein ABI357_00505 [Granulicella sp.]
MHDLTPPPAIVAEVTPLDILPDAPSALQTSSSSAPAILPCKPDDRTGAIVTTDTIQPPCAPTPDRSPYQRFLNFPEPLMLTPRQKGVLAVRNVIDPANLATIGLTAGFTIGIDSHTAYGPGFKGFGRYIVYSVSQDATGEFFSTFALASLLHQDPHYHRMPTAPVPRRLIHAIGHTVISQHDDGTPMINYSTLLTYPISAEISNLYVPGVAVNGPSTVRRIIIGIASNPIDDIITEFLPDFAKRVHIRVVFMQQILNNISTGQTM